MNTKDKILVVEDDEPTSLAITFKLKKEGFVVIQAGDGEKGLEALTESGPFSGVLLDLRMPKGDGFKFLEEKAKNPKISGVPVIVFTNLSQPEFVNRALKLGVKGYLVKAHHSAQEIVEELHQCLHEGKCTIDY